MTEIIQARPFLRWAGSKQRFASTIIDHFPDAYGTYYEPFAGAASIFFALNSPHAILSDTNGPLMDTYREVKGNVEAVVDLLRRLQRSEREYYRVRDRYRPRSGPAIAARLIYLNQYCWNGLHRVNSNGQFNVPYGRRPQGFRIDFANLRACAQALQRATIQTADFETSVTSAKRDDLVYFDPPYVIGHTNNGFVGYNARLFSWADQTRLAATATELSKRGCHVAITNADHEAIRHLYRKFTIIRYKRTSTIAADAKKRGPSQELVILSTPG